MTATSRAPLPDGGWLSYREAGQGPPLVLLRPLGGSMRLWGELSTTLSRHHRVVAFDPRGVGQSSDPPLLVSTRTMAADAVALLDYLELARVSLFGLSLGGMTASWVAIDHPERVERLVLASTLPRALDLSARGAEALLSMSGSLWRPGVRAELSMIHRVLSKEFRDANPARMRAIDASVRKEPTRRRNLVALAMAAARHNPGTRWQDIQCPTLVLVGDRDPLMSPAARADLLDHIPHAELQVIASSGHDVSLEQPRETSQRVSAFLR